MASKRDSRQSKIVRRQTFQNSSQIIEMTLRAIPKSALQNLTSTVIPPPFVRDCALKKEIQNVMKEKNNNTCNVGPKKVSKLPLNNRNTKTSGGQVTYEVSRKKSIKKQHNIVPHDATWEAVLQSCSTVSSQSESDMPAHSTALYASSESSRIVVNEKSPVNVCERTSQGMESRCSESRKRQSETERNPHQHNRSVQTLVFSPTQLLPHSDNSLNECEYLQKTDRISEKVGTRISSQKRNDMVRESQVNKSKNQDAESLPPNLHFQSRSGQERVHENERLLSDDVNASPFGESALQLLQQLRERLQSRGDSEGTDLVGVIEAFISGQGTCGGVGASNPQRLISAISPVYPPVFPPSTDQGNILHSPHNRLPQYHKHKCSKKRILACLCNECHQSITQQSDAEIAPEPNPEQTSKDEMEEHLQGEQQLDNENPQQSPDHSTTLRKYPCESNLQQFPDRHNLNQASEPHTTQSDLHSQNQEVNDLNKFIREIAKQKEIMADQERNITELRKLCAQLIAQQEQIALKNMQQAEVGFLNCKCCIRAQHPVTDGDSGVGIESREKSSESIVVPKVAQSGECEKEEAACSDKDRDSKERDTVTLNHTKQEYQSILMLLKTENETLRREVRSQRELVVNLEIQLTKAKYLLELERRSQLRLFASKLSGSAPNLELVGHQIRTTTRDDKSTHIGAPSDCSESEADSAYEEKTGSHLTSKISSPHSDKQKGQACGIGLAKVSSPQLQQNEVDRDKKVLNVDDILSGSALLQTKHINKDSTMPYAFKNSTVIPTSQLMQQQLASETQELSEETRSSTSDQSPEAQKIFDHENFLRNSRKRTTKTPSTQKSCLAKTRGILNDVGVRVSDLSPKPWVPLEYPTDSSFSTVSDQIQDGSVTNETSFLEGIKAPRQSRNPMSEKSRIDYAEDISNSVIGVRNPLESTRVQENSELQVNIKDDESSLFVPIKANNSFESVDELE
ncbi:uncharacterized protein [Panulirus ornatus]